MENNLKKHQKCATKALEALVKILDRHKIKYYLLAGSCLGAVRHKGFIPWDDDIDIGILNEDYRRLDAILRKEMPKPFVWISNSTDKNYPRLFGKITYNNVGCIDLFRIIHMTEDKKRQKIMWIKNRFLWKLFVRKCNLRFDNESNFNYYTSKIIALFFEKKQIIRMCRKNEKKYSGNGDYINLYSIYGFEKETIKKEWIEKQSFVEFEGKKYTTVSDTDAYLTHLYGDYMTPPPDSEKKLRHINNLFGNVE